LQRQRLLLIFFSIQTTHIMFKPYQPLWPALFFLLFLPALALAGPSSQEPRTLRIFHSANGQGELNPCG
jgi:hypothetical protein